MRCLITWGLLLAAVAVGAAGAALLIAVLEMLEAAG